MYTIVGSCPKCGSPVYTPTMWNSVLPPPSMYSCGCRGEQNYYVTTTNTTITDSSNINR